MRRNHQPKPQRTIVLELGTQDFPTFVTNQEAREASDLDVDYILPVPMSLKPHSAYKIVTGFAALQAYVAPGNQRWDHT